MQTNPKENRIHIDHILIDQFLRKGYRCEEVIEENATIFIITHERKNQETVLQATNETYKDFLRTN